MSNYVEQKDCFSAQKTMAEKIQKVHEEIAEVKISIASLPDELIKRLDGRYASKEEIAPLKSIVYGMVGFILLAFIGAVVALVIKKQI